MSVCVPRSEEKHVVPVGGPRHYPVKTCAERGWHRVFKVPVPFEDCYKCGDCGEVGPSSWARIQLMAQGEFFLQLGEAIEDLARTQIRERRTIFDSANEGLNQAASRAGGKQ